MNHNAGWQEVPVDINLAYSNRIKPLGETFKDSEPFQIYEPGTVTAYSNWGASLVAGNMDLSGITDRVFDFRGMASHLNIDKNNHVLQIQVN